MVWKNEVRYHNWVSSSLSNKSLGKYEHIAENQNTMKRYTEAILEASEKFSTETSTEKFRYMCQYQNASQNRNINTVNKYSDMSNLFGSKCNKSKLYS